MATTLDEPEDRDDEPGGYRLSEETLRLIREAMVPRVPVLPFAALMEPVTRFLADQAASQRQLQSFGQQFVMNNAAILAAAAPVHQIAAAIAQANVWPTELYKNFASTSLLNTFAELGRQQAALSANYAGMLARIKPLLNLPDFKLLFRGAQPHNWDDVADETTWSDLIDLARSGIPTTWVPRAEVLDALLDAEDGQVYVVLVDHAEQVLADCRAALEEVSTGEYAEQADMLVEAVTAYAHGLSRSAQATAAAVLDTLLRLASSKWSGYNALLRLHPVDGTDVTVGKVRYYTTMVPLHLAVKRFEQEKGDPIPTVFNRHASTHAACAIQYTPANALVALTLAVSIAREMHEQRAEAAADEAA